MSLKQKITPYEVLIRFDENGEYKGAHVGYLKRVFEGDRLLAQEQELKEISDEKFPLSEVMNDVQAKALKRVETLDTELNNANSNCSQLSKELEDLKKELQQTQSELVEAQRVNQELINNIKVDESNNTEEVER